MVLVNFPIYSLSEKNSKIFHVYYPLKQDLVLLYELLRGEKDARILLKKINEGVKKLTSMSEIMSIGTPRLPKKIWGLGATPLYGAQGAHFGVFGPPGPHRGGWPPDPKFFLGSLGVPNRHNFTH